MVSTMPAIPGKVKVTSKEHMTPSMIKMLRNRATLATSPAVR